MTPGPKPADAGDPAARSGRMAKRGAALRVEELLHAGPRPRFGGFAGSPLPRG